MGERGHLAAVLRWQSLIKGLPQPPHCRNCGAFGGLWLLRSAAVLRRLLVEDVVIGDVGGWGFVFP